MIQKDETAVTAMAAVNTYPVVLCVCVPLRMNNTAQPETAARTAAAVCNWIAKLAAKSGARVMSWLRLGRRLVAWLIGATRLHEAFELLTVAGAAQIVDEV